MVEDISYDAGIIRISYGIASTVDDAVTVIGFLESFTTGTNEIGVEGAASLPGSVPNSVPPSPMRCCQPKIGLFHCEAATTAVL